MFSGCEETTFFSNVIVFRVSFYLLFYLVLFFLIFLMYVSRSGHSTLLMELSAGEDARLWKGRDVVLWGTEVRTSCAEIYSVF